MRSALLGAECRGTAQKQDYRSRHLNGIVCKVKCRNYERRRCTSGTSCGGQQPTWGGVKLTASKAGPIVCSWLGFPAQHSAGLPSPTITLEGAFHLQHHQQQQLSRDLRMAAEGSTGLLTSVTTGIRGNSSRSSLASNSDSNSSS
jgi:hypothetical protein